MDNEEGTTASEPNEPPSTVLPAVPIARESLVNWLPRLFFRPVKFFTLNARVTPGFVVQLCAYILGAAWSLTYYMDSARRADLPEHAPAAYVFGSTFVYAIIGGAFWYFVAGTWYGVRLSLCSPRNMTWKLSRQTFIFSELVYALPCVIGMSIWWVIQDQSFLLAAAIVVGVAMFWSVYVSYRGVRTLFQAARIRAVVLFIVLPALLYTACFVAPALLMKAKSHLSVLFENAAITMDRPANWEPVKSPGPGAVSFHIPNFGGFAVTVRDAQGGIVDLERTAHAMGQAIAMKFQTVAKELDGFSTWGNYSGHGLRISMTAHGDETIVRIFCGTLPDGRVLTINEISETKAASELETQFEVVRKTLHVKPIK